MMIGQDTAYAGDMVWSNRFGIGSVLTTWNNGCTVSFQRAPGTTLHYESGGYRNGQRELFWAQPIVIEAGKNDRPETMQKAARMARELVELARA